MVYCSKCGNKNDDGAEFCSKCGASLKEGTRYHRKPNEDFCEDQCEMGKHSKSAPVFWGVIVILIGIWFLFEFVIKNTTLQQSLPPELINFEWWWLIGLVIVFAIIATGIKMIIKR